MKELNLEEICTLDTEQELQNDMTLLKHITDEEDLLKALSVQEKQYSKPEFMEVWNGNTYCSIKPSCSSVECKYRADTEDDNGLYMCLYDDIKVLYGSK